MQIGICSEQSMRNPMLNLGGLTIKNNKKVPYQLSFFKSDFYVHKERQTLFAHSV